MLLQKLISKYKYNTKCPYAMKPVGVCIHNTANDSSAKNEIAYMQSNNNEVSFHIAVDDIEAIQGIPFDRNAWHAGDGGSGQGNRNYIAVEICYSLSGGDRFTKAEQRAAIEVAALLKRYGWGIDKVKAHRDFSNKNCPHRTNMDNFKYLVQVELNKLNLTTTVQPTKKYVNLKAHMTRWRVYPEASPTVVGNEAGFLNPSLGSASGGLSYTLLKEWGNDTYSIKTSTFGIVKIYCPNDEDGSVSISPLYEFVS